MDIEQAQKEVDDIGNRVYEGVDIEVTSENLLEVPDGAEAICKFLGIKYVELDKAAIAEGHQEAHEVRDDEEFAKICTAYVSGFLCATYLEKIGNP